MTRSQKLIDKGMQCLIDNLGIIEAEKFIMLVLRERVDYTEWQREHYDNMTAAELYAALLEYENHDESFAK